MILNQLIDKIIPFITLKDLNENPVVQLLLFNINSTSESILITIYMEGGKFT